MLWSGEEKFRNVANKADTFLRHVDYPDNQKKQQKKEGRERAAILFGR